MSWVIQAQGGYLGHPGGLQCVIWPDVNASLVRTFATRQEALENLEAIKTALVFLPDNRFCKCDLSHLEVSRRGGD